MTATQLATFPPQIVAALGGRQPTAEQWRAISMPPEPCAVVAGAGSGKTSVMAARVVYLALVGLGAIDADHRGILPGNVLCLTFTNKATENLALRVRGALSTIVDLPEGEEPVVMNYHGFAAQIIERHGLRVGLEPGTRVLTPAQREEVAGRVLDRMTFQSVKAEWQPSVVDAVLKLAEQAANHLVSPEEIVAFNEERLGVLRGLKAKGIAKAAEQRIELAQAVRIFQDLKAEMGVYDFGDQIRIALDIVQRFPEVAADYRQRFHAALLDEYQDTNVAQARLISHTFGEGFPITAVGDPDQNIYAWRGASLFNLLHFPDQFPTSGGAPAPVLPLYTNFRSGSRILAAADHILAPLPDSQRADPDKHLVPWGANGTGDVELARFSDEWTEACWIADRAVGRHEAGDRWGDIAVLCRKSRLFTPLQQAFAERGIPVEIIGLAGLLKLPAVQEVLAYARAVVNPFASVSLARILLGPRYRVGYKDLALVAGWASAQNRAHRDELDDERSAFLLAEALEHLDEIEGLSTEGRDRLEEFAEELEQLRVEARRPVGEFFAEVIRRIGLLSELDANLEVQPALATKRNLAAFLDEVHGFTPLEGELTLRAFLDYADVVEQAERQEWSPVQPSNEDSVKAMTVHQAKGLEFDTVFVPGLADGLLPDMGIQQNPAERGYSLDFDLRGDRDVLPVFDGVLKTFKEDLRRQEEFEERRTCYVALTRARKRLFVTGAHWYGEGVYPKRPSILFEELAAWADDTGSAVVDRGPDAPASDDENPLLGYRERFVRDWPGRALRPEADALFHEGWRAAALQSSRAGGVVQSSILEALDPGERTAYEADAMSRRLLAAHLVERDVTARREPPLPSTLSVSSVIDYARCPKRFYWSVIRPLPRFSGPAARVGTQVHRWIELQSRGQATLLEEDEHPDLTSEELAGQPGKVDQLRTAFQDSRFARVAPLFAERPFLLRIGEFVVNGRIDAIYGGSDGRWEVVDYKTGRRPADGQPIANLQLELYALACIDVWGKRPEELTLTYLYLASREEASYPVGDPAEIRGRILEDLRAMASGAFVPTPGPQCRWCDFQPFCDAGTSYLSTIEGSSHEGPA